MQKNKPVPFKILWVNACTLGVLHRGFLGRLWGEILGTKPVVDTIRMSDDDIVDLGTPPCFTFLMIDIPKPGKMNGFIVMWVDNLNAAATWLRDRQIPLAPTAGPYEGVEIDQTFLGEKVVVRLDQAPDHIMKSYKKFLRAR